MILNKSAFDSWQAELKRKQKGKSKRPAAEGAKKNVKKAKS